VKNLSTLIRATALALPRLPDLNLWLVGHGHERESLEALVRELGVLDHVTFWGERLDVAGFFAAADVYCMSSVSEGLPMSLLQATLTLPGMAGILLTLGMAVDANILINERIREEQRLGRPPLAALEHGFRRAYSTIFDSNATAFLAHVMLFAFGSGPVRGFAVTITVGIATSLFTAWMLTRLLVSRWYVATRPKLLPV